MCFLAIILFNAKEESTEPICKWLNPINNHLIVKIQCSWHEFHASDIDDSPFVFFNLEYFGKLLQTCFI